MLKRLEQSQAKGAVPKSDVDDAKTVVELAKVTLIQAQTELEDRKSNCADKWHYGFNRC
ncbi:hypothetical protein P4S68_04370 [Pseudoalteromonas sp. Hal099]